MNYHRITKWMQDQCLLDTWTFWHTIQGAIWARVFVEFMSPTNAVSLIIAAGVVWEIYELVASYVRHGDAMYGYSRWQLWANNTGSDLFVETLAACLVVFFWDGRCWYIRMTTRQ